MDKPIMMSTQDVVNVILATCAALVTISSAIAVIMRFVARIRQPEKDQDARLTKVEDDIKKIQHCLSIDKARLDNIEYGNTITQEALLALLDHALNKDDTETVKQAKKKLEKYLIDKERIPYKADDRYEDDLK
jgi:SpoVK/Ycf46/Vps4 family AAA+-type ATPase